MHRIILFGLVMALSAMCWAQEIVQVRGVDQRLDYKSLTDFGPWDDRNYQLTLEDLAFLSPEEDQLDVHIPAFFRVLMRKANPNLPRTGEPQYPRSAPEIFRQMYGGLLVDGRIINTHKSPTVGDFGMATHKVDNRVPVNGEIQINTVTGAAESAILINPVDPMRIIGGANGGAGGQEMYFSTDGGATWSQTPPLSGNTCCDPTVGWSRDGSIAYSATLGNCGFSGCNIWFYRSTDGGETWGGRIDLTSAGASDKEFLHVDTHPTSPHVDNIYLVWHDGNVQQFARSTDLGLSFDPVISFGAAPIGIGSDVTTDPAGNVYYIYPGTTTMAIWLLKSTDGGQTFAAPVKIDDTFARFDFPIPSFDTRNVFVHASADSDRSGGPFDGSIYTCWVDTTAPESGTPSQNHSRIVFAYSRDAGATWTSVIPHPTDDLLTVDRFNPWMEVDANGTIHIIFYDTQRDPNRLMVDLFYTYSQDGGVTFIEPERITSVQSNKINDNFEWGDYNGMSVNLVDIRPIWTDNRAEAPGPVDVDVYTALVENVTGEPDFLLNLDQNSAIGCVPSQVMVNADLGQIQGFSNAVTLSAPGAPAGVNVSFGSNPTAPPALVSVTIDITGAAVPGEYTFDIEGAATGSDGRVAQFTLTVQNATPIAPVLVSPADGEPNAGLTNVALNWDDVADTTGYRVQVSTDMTFSSVDIDDTTTDSEYLAGGLTAGLTYYWRVLAINACGDGSYSAARSFFTDSELVFLVDQDDDTPDVLTFFTDTLDALGVSYVVHDYDAMGAPSVAMLSQHPVTIWFSGNRFAGPGATDVNNLEDYVTNNGGAVFLSSQDYLFGFSSAPPANALSLFGIDTYTDDNGDYTSVMAIGGSIFDGLGPYTLDYSTVGGSDFSDPVTVAAGSMLALEGNNANGAAIQTDMNTVFFAFPFPALHDASLDTTSQPLQDVMQAILDFLAPETLDCGMEDQIYEAWFLSANYVSVFDWDKDGQIDVRDIIEVQEFCGMMR